MREMYEAATGDKYLDTSLYQEFGGQLDQNLSGSCDDEDRPKRKRPKRQASSSIQDDITSQDSSSDSPAVEPMQGVKVVTEKSAQEVLEANLDPLVLPMTDQIDTQTLAKMRSRFCSRVQALEMTISKDRKQMRHVTFTPIEVAQITNFFFSDMLGVKALKRLSDLVKFYAEEGEDDVNQGLSSRARILADDCNTPQILRAYYDHLHKATDHVKQNPVLKQVHHNLRQLDFLQEHRRLKSLAQQKDPQLAATLKDLGYTITRGAPMLSCLLDLLSKSLAIPKTSISNIIQSFTGVEKLVELFGEGVILLLPPCTGRQ
jgi:hypothetical protein